MKRTNGDLLSRWKKASVTWDKAPPIRMLKKNAATIVTLAGGSAVKPYVRSDTMRILHGGKKN
jgi:hypothetical protein